MVRVLGCALLLLLFSGAAYVAWGLKAGRVAFVVSRFAKEAAEAQLEAKTLRFLLVWGPLALGLLAGLMALRERDLAQFLLAFWLLLYAYSNLRPDDRFLALYWAMMTLGALGAVLACLVR